MKNLTLTLLAAITLSSAAHATTEVQYQNDEGCVVTAEKRLKGTIFWVQTKEARSVVGVTNDLQSADFAYCSQDAIHINSFKGAKGTGILISCSEHQNDHAVTRGRVDISILNGQLDSINIDGQVKKMYSWKQDTLISCENLKPVSN